MDNKYDTFFIREGGNTNPLPAENVEQDLAASSITGYHIGKNVIRADHLLIGNKGWSSNVTWTTSASRIDWNAHTLILADNTAISIAAGHASITSVGLRYYIYYKNGDSTYSVSTIQADSVGNDRILVNTATVDANGVVTFFPVDSYGTQISGDNIKTGKIQSTDGKTYFDLNGGKIQISKASTPTVRLASSPPYLVIAKPGFDANTATDAQSLIKVDDDGSKIYSQAVFSNGAQQQVNDFNLPNGFVARDTTIQVNYYTGTRFYVPSSWTIINVVLQIESRDVGDSGGGSYVLTRPTNLSILLNPTRTTNGGGATAYYWTFSGGQTIASGVNPGSDGATFDYTFDSTQKNAITAGWNEVIIQQGTNDTSKFGVIVVNMFVDYSLKLT